jgi:hypothetical protein
VGDAFQRPDFAYVLVTRPNPVALELAREFSHSLEQRGLGTDLLVLNRTTRVASEALARQGVAALEPRLSALTHAAVQGAVEQRIARKERERAQIAALVNEAQLKACPRLELPALQVGVSELGELGRLADAFARCW